MVKGFFDPEMMVYWENSIIFAPEYWLHSIVTYRLLRLRHRLIAL